MTYTKSKILESKHLPRFIYGTAWKEENTAECTFQALKAGFRAIDTANQRKHYFEEGVGEGLSQFLNLNQSTTGVNSPITSKITRADLFLQTKFTFANGQDHRKPYNESDPYSLQVEKSYASSLKHLNTNYLDSYVLHGPSAHQNITEIDLEVWMAMENLYHDKKVRHLGISNVTAQQLVQLCEKVKIKPQFVQNRCYARMGWDKEVRKICNDLGVIYQGFSLLTANLRELSSSTISQLATRYGKSIPQIVFRFSQQIGMIPLTGSTSADHLALDLDIEDFELNEQELSQIENIGIL